jgi:hypothetical protein
MRATFLLARAVGVKPDSTKSSTGFKADFLWGSGCCGNEYARKKAQIT